MKTSVNMSAVATPVAAVQNPARRHQKQLLCVNSGDDSVQHTQPQSSPENPSITLGIMSSMNFCPPKPGSTVMTRAMWIWFAQGASSSTVVSGFMAKPTCRDTACQKCTHLNPRIHPTYLFYYSSLFCYLHATLFNLLDEVSWVGGGL